MNIKKQLLRRAYFFLTPVFIFILNIPFVFGKWNHVPVISMIPSGTEDRITKDPLPVVPGTTNHLNSAYSVYDSIHLDGIGLSRGTFNYAIKGFNYLAKAGKLANDKIISIIDFSLPSSVKRLFVIDLDNYKVLFCTYVAHGVNSGVEYANRFSNKPSSYKSSLGFYETQNTYQGGNGYSLKLEGLERGINDNANRRDIVIHGAAYVDEALVRSQGYIGRSWGCPALPEKLHRPIINTIKDGTCLFIYSPDKTYLHRSKILNTAG